MHLATGARKIVLPKAKEGARRDRAPQKARPAVERAKANGTDVILGRPNKYGVTSRVLFIELEQETVVRVQQI